ncbi:MAG: hypothetical protein GC204_02010 [Chloroflexi bacterium]|nr:hypothetical protein [Chloroflexota bacterium]
MGYSMTQDRDDTFLWTFTGEIDAALFHSWFVDTRQRTIDAVPLMIYHIMDVRAAHTDFTAVLTQMREVGKAGGSPDGRHTLQVLLVGTDAMARLAANLAKLPQFGGFEMPMFHSLEDARESVRIDRIKRQNVTP